MKVREISLLTLATWCFVMKTIFYQQNHKWKRYWAFIKWSFLYLVRKDTKLSGVVGLDPVTVTASIDEVWGSALTAVSASKSHTTEDKRRSRAIDLAQRSSCPGSACFILGSFRGRIPLQGQDFYLEGQDSCWISGCWEGKWCVSCFPSFLPTLSHIQQAVARLFSLSSLLKHRSSSTSATSFLLHPFWLWAVRGVAACFPPSHKYDSRF